MTRRSKPHPKVAALHDKAFSHGINITEALARATPPVAGSTWTRWKAGGDPLEETLSRIDAALDELINESEYAG